MSPGAAIFYRIALYAIILQDYFSMQQPQRGDYLVMFIFYSIHYPLPGKEELLAQSMHEFGELMRKQPGNLFQAPYPFKDPEKGTLMGVSIWKSEEAFQVALPTLQQARRNSSSQEWEARPPEVYTLHSIH